MHRTHEGANHGRTTAATNEPWYKDGLRFKCTGCGDCCTGAPGYVWVNNEEIAKMAAVVRMSVEEFEAEYVRELACARA